MDRINPSTYEEENVTVKVERIFLGEKTRKERILELLEKRCQSRDIQDDRRDL